MITIANLESLFDIRHELIDKSISYEDFRSITIAQWHFADKYKFIPGRQAARYFLKLENLLLKNNGQLKPISIFTAIRYLIYVIWLKQIKLKQSKLKRQVAKRSQ